MRTTLTIDDDVAVRIERLRREGDSSLKEIVNELLRRALDAGPRPKPKKPYKLRTFDCGKPLIPNIDNVAEVLAVLDDDALK